MKFCEKCGKELMDDAVMCPACGYTVEAQKPQPAAYTPAPMPNTTVQNQSKQGMKDLFLFRLIANAVGAISGVLSIIFGIVIVNLPCGILGENEAYGGDAYTGIQNASILTANNVFELTDDIKHIACYFMICFGFALIAIFISGIFKICADRNKQS
ncbi:MAG: hypothetical protein ACI4N4_04035 [Candidatus Fimenecus sp.]